MINLFFSFQLSIIIGLWDPYYSCMIQYDGGQKPNIRVFGQNQKNNQNFTLAWDKPTFNMYDKVSSKVGNERTSYIPEYTVQTYTKNTQITENSMNSHVPIIAPLGVGSKITIKAPTKFAAIAERNFQRPDEQVNCNQLVKNLSNKTNEQIMELLNKQRMENQVRRKEQQLI